MERQIKFRVWDKESKAWIGDYSNNWIGTGIGNIGGPDIQPWKCMSLKGEIMSNDNMGGFVDSNQENYIIQQFTGLKDKNGKDIYEGDIVIDLDNQNGIVEYKHGSFIVNEFKINVIIPFYSILYKDNMVQPRLINPETFKIIGNIFENPELLK